MRRSDSQKHIRLLARMQVILALLLCLSPAGAGVLDTSDDEIHPVFASLPLGWNLHTLGCEGSKGFWIEAPGDRYLVMLDAPSVQAPQTFAVSHAWSALPTVHLSFAVIPTVVDSLPFVPLFCRLRDGPPTEDSPRAPPIETVKPLI